MPGASADSIVSPGRTAPRRRATISISGSSGMPSTLESSGTHGHVGAAGGAGDRAPRRRASSRRSSASPRRRATCHGAEECAAICAALLPAEAEVERPAVLLPGHAPDLLARLRGTGTRRILLLGHVDTVDRPRAPQAAAPRRRPPARLGLDRHEGRRRARPRRAARARRRGRPTSPRRRCCSCATRSGARRRSATSSASPAGTRACASRPASSRPTGDEGVVVRRKAAGTIKVRAKGRAAHSGSAPDRGRNALLALAAAAQAVAACHAPDRPGAPDRRADRAARRRRVQRRARPRRADLRPARGLRRGDHRRARRDPARRRRRHARAGADAAVAGHALRGRHARRCSSAPARRSGGPVVGVRRGGASDASHLAAGDPAHGRRARAARRQGAQPGRVRARARRWRAVPRSRSR